MKRRDFLKWSALGLGSVTTGMVRGAVSYDDSLADRKLRVGVIGPGWYGKIDVLRLIQVAPVEVVSLCDVDQPTLDEACQIVASRQESHREPRKFHDYRDMLAEKDLDLVLIDTPDHWHALQMIAAVESGADVYVQKPIAVDVAECKAMLTAARANQRVVQVGLQRRSTPHLIEAKERFIDSGALGKVGHVEIFSYYGGPGQTTTPPCEPPADFDYDLWTGPAPMRPYYPQKRRGGWRMFKEYGNGTLGDMGVHMFDMTRWFLGLAWPRRVSSTGGIYLKKESIGNTPDTQTVVFDYDDLQIIWNHRTWSEVSDPKYPWGATLYGEKGILKAGVFGYDFHEYGKETVSADVTYEYERYPEDKTEPGLERHVSAAVRNHMKNLLHCMADRTRPVSDIEEGMISSISCILGNMALDLHRTLEWDPVSQTVKNDDEANSLLARPYREPWVHP
ncbi:MAG: Gfo/Idh/MocA family oxidoreductase [Planctomycetia bacterium]|nr:Gfo/Idh/MocA family oxidoreductase [Planctomycetia bacterium]